MICLKKSTYILLLVFVAACSTRKVANNPSANIPAQLYIDSVVQQYAPDKRTALFNVTAKGNVLSGETNLTEAKSTLLQKLHAANILLTVFKYCRSKICRANNMLLFLFR
jgi:hypothetical protein